MKVALPISKTERKIVTFYTLPVHEDAKSLVWGEDKYGAYITWPSVPGILPLDKNQGDRTFCTQSVTYSHIESTPSPIKGVHGTTVNSCNHCAIDVDPIWTIDGSPALIKLDNYAIGPITHKAKGTEWCCFEQLIMDKDRKGFWTIKAGPGVVITSRANLCSITHWTLSSNGLVGRQWYNGYGGFNYCWQDNGTWVTSIDGQVFKLGSSHVPSPKSSGSYFTTQDPVTKFSTIYYLDGSVLDPEIMLDQASPYLMRLLYNQLPQVARKAWNNFKLSDSNLLVELLDSLFTIETFRDALPTNLKDTYDLSVSNQRSWRNIHGKWMKRIKGKYVPVTKAELITGGLTKQQTLKAIAAGRLEYQYGIKLPLSTLSEVLKDDTSEPWAESIRSYFKRSDTRLANQLYQPILRHRENFGNYQVSCTIQQRLDPDYFFIEIWKALYASGILMTFEGAWDLFPLSFLADWFTGLPKAIMEQIDATTISQMVKVEQYSYSIKFEEKLDIDTEKGSSVGKIKFYIRKYTTDPPATGIGYKDLLPNFRAKFIPELGSILYLLSN